MLWGDEQDADLRDYFKSLIHFRHSHPVLRQGQRQTLHVDGTTGLYAYTVSDDTETVLVVMNVSGEERPLTLHLPHHTPITVTLPPWAGNLQTLEVPPPPEAKALG
jgi:glycosidase